MVKVFSAVDKEQGASGYFVLTDPVHIKQAESDRDFVPVAIERLHDILHAAKSEEVVPDTQLRADIAALASEFEWALSSKPWSTEAWAGFIDRLRRLSVV